MDCAHHQNMLVHRHDHEVTRRMFRSVELRFNHSVKNDVISILVERDTMPMANPISRPQKQVRRHQGRLLQTVETSNECLMHAVENRFE